MKRTCISIFTLAALVLSPALRADDVEGTPEGTPVGQASAESSNASKSKTWQNIGIATGAVAIAVTALILVSTNNGHHHHHHHSSGQSH